MPSGLFVFVERRERTRSVDPQHVALMAITFGAAIVNGALGYGFSSLTVPLALLFLTNRVLNPALVPVEVVAERVRAVGEPRRAVDRVAPRAADRHRPGAGRDRRARCWCRGSARAG